MNSTKLPFSDFRKVGNLVFISGQVELTPKGILLQGTIEEKTHQVMKNLKKVLKDADMDFANVVMTHIYLAHIEDRPAVSDVYISYLSEPYPARVMLAIKDLPLGASVEISMIASK